jgi:hypothetical protein
MPNPCGQAETGEKPCGCPRGDTQPVPRGGRKRPKRRRTDCCDQLIDALSGLEGSERLEFHKPKQRIARKAGDLCRAFGVADAITPLVAALWERHTAGEKPRNEFESRVDRAFAAVDEANAKDLTHAVEQYKKVRAAGKADCLFDDCLSQAAQETPIEATWVAQVILREGLKVAGQTLFENSLGEMGPGQARLWDNQVFRGPNGSGATVYQGPWPWITAIAPDTGAYQEYGNLLSFRPEPGKAHVWQNYQYDQSCTYTPSPGGSINATCSRKHPAPPSPGSLLPNFCEGGQHYTRGNDCIRIPSIRPGGSLKLRGFNFITDEAQVRVVRQSDPSVAWGNDCPVWGDQTTPLKDSDEHYIVDERVKDWIDVQIPSSHPTISGAPLPAGLYEVSVRVPNVTNAVYDGGTPTELVSNTLLVRIEADPNVKYLLWSDSGRCNRETPGFGSDEIWWDAFVGHIAPNEVPVPPGGASSVELKDLQRRSFPRPAWNDMDDGESAAPYSIDIWGPRAFDLGGVAVIGMVGFEVDSEDAAKKQLKGFWDAWSYALMQVAGIASGMSATGTGLAKIAVDAGLIAAKTALSAALIAFAIIAAITLIATALWAAWAPADLIALDVMHLDASNAWERTEPHSALPTETVRHFGDPADDDNLVTVRERALTKEWTPGDAAATWRQENQYDTPDDGEDASYTLTFKLARS